MQQATQATAATKTIPQSVIERLEAEWKQMRDHSQQQDTSKR